MTEQTHIVVFLMIEGPPLIVGTFADHDTAVGFLNGDNVVDELYKGAWVQTLVAAATNAVYSPVELSGKCHCNG